ncbi:uncharacterized protein LOC122961579 [Acropora millepora]|uniref:uncharacterized protein LOC122961579 n=1 Tax=Acropora millepora TaxID=45264 RepID=UPI001CF5EA2F|nr:uncharacterized protein LOC122961579 [Acropora millepora]
MRTYIGKHSCQRREQNIWGELGEEVVREVASPPTYGYVEAMKNMLFTLPKVQIKKVLDDYAKRALAPLNSQFPDRRGKEEAVQAYKVRKQKKMKTPLYPPGAEQDVLEQNSRSRVNSKSRKSSGGHCKRM